MKLTIKNGSIFGATSLALILIFGTDAPAHLKAAAHKARAVFEEWFSTDYLAELARAQYAEQRDKILDAEVTLKGQRENVELAEDELGELELQLGEAQRRLGLLRPALESGSGIGAFSHADVEADVKALVDFAERTTKARDQRKTRLETLRDALASHEGILAQAREDFEAAETNLEGLAAELEAREAAADAEALASNIRHELSAGREGIQRTFDVLKKRRDRLELEAARKSSSSGLPRGRVVLDGDRAEASRSLLERLDTIAPAASDAAPQPSPAPASTETANNTNVRRSVPVRIGTGGTPRCRL